ncbi:hypothetical protein CIW54_06070 [Paraburkholderia sp. T12-10]|nr:hypothetical protein CIW54_06070 [Paraburkholderia sp. T12-10]
MKMLTKGVAIDWGQHGIQRLGPTTDMPRRDRVLHMMFPVTQQFCGMCSRPSGGHWTSIRGWATIDEAARGELTRPLRR